MRSKRGQNLTSPGLQLYPGGCEGLFLQKKRPIVMGTGLIALDIVITDRDGVEPRYWAGGTCGNVLAILAYLGWRAYPVATLGKDIAAARVLEDLKRFGVSVRFLRPRATQHTPVVVERIRIRSDGTPRHRFVWNCPNCGAWLPGYRAVSATRVREMVNKIPVAQVFFFDRVSRGALELARASSARGSLVVFEPSGIRDEKLFREALRTSHIVKYSRERLGHLREGSRYPAPMLEIETLATEGLRYRLRGGLSPSSKWREMEAYQIDGVRDAAGAGDWCTAGVLHALGRKGLKGLREATEERIDEALRLGQALAVLACKYEGARGGMYALSKKKMEAAVQRILGGDLPSCETAETREAELTNLLGGICPVCNGEGKMPVGPSSRVPYRVRTANMRSVLRK